MGTSKEEKKEEGAFEKEWEDKREREKKKNEWQEGSGHG